MYYLYLGAIVCVIGNSIGQILFKASALSLSKSGSYLDPKSLGILFTAFALYFISSLGWVMLLKRASLGQIYPFLALSFLLVPLASAFFFGEQFSPKYFVGIALIMLGIVFCTQTQAL